jgi:hypothetical protein
MPVCPLAQRRAYRAHSLLSAMFALSQASDQDLQVVILLLELHVHLNLLLRVVVRHQLVVLCSQRQQLV